MTDSTTDIELIDVPKVLELLGNLVKTYGDEHIASPRYANTAWNEQTTPECAVGQLAYRLGGVEALTALSEGWPVYLTNNAASERGKQQEESNRELLLNRLHFTPEAAEVLGWFQAIQDNGNTWGTALVDTELTAKERGWIK